MASKSPVSAASQQKVSSTPDPAPTAIPTSPQQPRAFPSPQTFDFLPPLHALLLRLISSTSTTNQPVTTTTTTTTTGGDASVEAAVAAASEQSQNNQSQQQQQQHKSTQQSTNSVTAPSTQGIHHPAGDSSLLGTSALPLQAKNLPTAASAIKIRIQKARAMVENMPDVERTVDEQEQEINQLQDRIARLKSVIADFGRRADSKEIDRMDMRD